MKNIFPTLKTSTFWIPLSFSLSMALLTLAAFFPGYMSPDSIGYLREALTGNFDDIHSPLMAATWRLLLFVWENAGSLFSLHVILYWALWTALARVAFSDWKKQLGVLAVASLPPLWSQVTVVWSDPELSITLLGAYLLALGGSLVGKTPGGKKNIPKLICTGLSTFLFFYSTALRLNSAPALLPLAFYLVTTTFPKIPNLRKAALTLGLILASLGTSSLFIYGFLKPEKYHIFQFFEAYEIVGIFSQTRDASLIPPYWKKLNPGLTAESLLNNYSPYTEVPLSFWTDSPIRWTSEASNLSELRQKWKGAIGRYPRELLNHHWGVFKRLLGIGEPKIFFALFSEISENEFGLKKRGDPELESAFNAYFNYFRNSLFFRGWLYLTGLLALLIYQWGRMPQKHPFRLPALCSACSGFLYGIGYFIYPASAEFRFLYPAVSLFFFSAVLTLAWRVNQPPQKASASKENKKKRGVFSIFSGFLRADPVAADKPGKP